MPVSHAMLLGIAQGLTEVFPVSSSAHLVVLPRLLGWQYQGLSFDVALHMGTAIAFVVYFMKDWLSIIGRAFRRDNTPGQGLLWCIAAGTVPAVIGGLLLEKKAETIFRSPLLIAVMLLGFALILQLADYLGKKQRGLRQIDMKTAFVIGLAQVLALIPGVSRSGITITAGLFAGLSREAAARFSFLLATPIVLAAGLLKLPKLQGADLTTAFWMGIVCSAVSGWIGIHFLLNLVRRSSFILFVGYRILLAAVILRFLS